ncbi:sensor histidine kinase [Spirosoma montaniterrae]|uniref:Signal transduction histidine kinase internal region domain-containing protein n=1 Tax=Spirosoma montaniterrae TaxID=1178516 RepID=A0A1P9WTL9_9BACT|nr:histidine kinase [Spirosoma montaniterrae]AQG78717.1 hypothetical protein AWR27_04830 [Spirosoma montaniterrae]
MDRSSPVTKLRQAFHTPRGYVYTAAFVTSAIRYVLILTLFPQYNATERLFFASLSFFFILLMWEVIHAFNQYLNRILPFESGVLRRFLIQTGCCLVVMVIIHTVFMNQFDRYYKDYFTPQFARAIKVASYFLDVLVVLAVNTAFFGFYFFGQWKKNLIEKETWAKERALLHQERISAQYDNLRNQLNPHFLFNSLSSLDGLIDDDPALARQFLQQLSKVFRYVLQHKDREQVPLETELSFIKNYISLLQTRFNGELQIECQISEESRDRQIVPVTLQILIENAIKHNVVSEARPLVIRLTTEDDYLTVSNPIQRKKQVATSNGLGLQNLQHLYGFLSKKPVLIEDNGVTFAVRVPLLE